jgi:signal peptidase I
VLLRLLARPFRLFGRITVLVLILTCTLLVFGTRGFYVYGSCMEPNLKTGERVLASRFSYWFGGPQRGDVVIFKYPCDPSKNYVKRVIGLPGDTVEIRRGCLLVNGEPLSEPYKLLAAHGDYGPQLVQAGKLFVLGDNRDQSNDSRYWGELPLENVQAKAVLLYWPPSRWHLLN